MAKKKIASFVILLLTITTLLITLNNKNLMYNNDKIIEKKEEDLTPITKTRVLKILEYEYGTELGNSEEDIKIDGKYYIIDVNLNVKSTEEHTHDEDEISELGLSSQATEGDIHKINLGVHKIDMYTGEISKVEEK
ncbi:MAG: hypothetical protein ACRDD7_02205 [Peptostreptococcaceae bacterium]